MTFLPSGAFVLGEARGWGDGGCLLGGARMDRGHLPPAVDPQTPPPSDSQCPRAAWPRQTPLS